MQSNWPPASALTSLGQSTVMPVVLSCVFSWFSSCVSSPPMSSDLLHATAATATDEQDGGASEPWSA